MIICHPLYSSQELECKGVIKNFCELDLLFYPNCIQSKKEKPFLEFKYLLCYHKENLDLQSILEAKCVTLLEIIFDLKGVIRKKSVDTLPNQ